MKGLKLFLLLGLYVAMTSSSCEEDGPVGVLTDVKINFLATYGDEPFILTLQDYAYPEGNMIRFKDEFGFYISDLVLLEKEGTDQTELSEIEYVNFDANASVATAESPFTLRYSAPIGDYKGIKFNIGVPADLNAYRPEDFGTNSPLAASGRYWSAWDSYTFLRLAGCYDRNGDGLETTCNLANEDDSSVVFHTGGDMAFRDGVTFLRSVELVAGETLELTLVVDVQKILAPQGDVIELGYTDQIHTNDFNDPVDVELINKAMDNLATKAISLQ